jgi:phage head maturation protease
LRVLFNDLDHVLGRTAARTARVWSEADGLHFEAIAPRTSWADDLIASIDRGDISGAGVWCDVTKSHFEYKGGEQIQVIEKADLKAVGVVSFQFFDESWAEAGSHSAVEQIAAGMTYTPSPRMEAL